MLQVHPIPAFDDNYIWLLHQEGVKDVAVVDPGDEEPVIDYLHTHGLQLSAILITHKHGDHTGGVAGLKRRWPDAQVYGPAHETIGVVEIPVDEGDQVRLPDLDIAFQVMAVPGHTEGHVAYYGHGMLFCGDTLFAAGCGRVFSGTFEQLSASLLRIAGLPADTLIYCAHEYTLDNLGFAQWVEPHNPVLAQRLIDDKAKRAAGRPTIPSVLAIELQTNPFLRTVEPAVIAAAEKWAGRVLTGHQAVFRALRQWKDRDYD